MSAKTTKKVLQTENVVDDVFGNDEVVKVEEKMEAKVETKSEEAPAAMEEDKLAKLKARLLAKEKEDKKAAMVAPPVKKVERSINFGCVGSGGAGGRLSSCFWNLGVNAIAINTAAQDLKHLNLPDQNKLLLEYASHGAAKSLEMGAAAAEANRDKI